MQERRIEPRLLCADLVDYHWKDSGGRKRRGVANLEDISLSGASLQVDRPVPLGTELHISYPNGELTGVVKYSVFRDIGYFLGVQFDEGCQWSQKIFKPQHLLDPRRLTPRVRSNDSNRAHG
ncbi:MAG: PilZ domain-containing protein [Acidobacteriota bacterium]